MCASTASLHVAVVPLLGYVGRLDDTIAIDLEEIDDAADEVDARAKVANARPLVGAAHDHLGELDLAWLRVEVERRHAHIALQLNEPVAVRVAAYVEAIQIAVVHLRAVHVQLLRVRRVHVDHVDVAVADVSSDEQRRVAFVVVVSTSIRKIIN